MRWRLCPLLRKSAGFHSWDCSCHQRLRRQWSGKNCKDFRGQRGIECGHVNEEPIRVEALSAPEVGPQISPIWQSILFTSSLQILPYNLPHVAQCPIFCDGAAWWATFHEGAVELGQWQHPHAPSIWASNMKIQSFDLRLLWIDYQPTYIKDTISFYQLRDWFSSKTKD